MKRSKEEIEADQEEEDEFGYTTSEYKDCMWTCVAYNASACNPVSSTCCNYEEVFTFRSDVTSLCQVPTVQNSAFVLPCISQ